MPVSEIEATLIEVFAELADLFGNPRSHGQVYGLLFSSTAPLTQEEIGERTEISLASVSQALRALESFGAVDKIPAPAVRTQATYTAHTALRPLVLGFIQNRLIPKLATSRMKLDAAQAMLKSAVGDQSELAVRLERVHNWHKRAGQLLAGADQILKMVGREPGRDR
jgi:DNA-binding transcriptional regulator GbsR (MarR family)